MIDPVRQRLTIAILALGGQGGGVLSDWIQHLGEHNGYRVQATSVPGVAQRTGSTIYYLELFPESGGDRPIDREPVLALMPAPGDVDIVIASELMEAGRAILRGFVSKERTTLIGSTHRIYAISEKSAMGNGLKSSDRIIAAAHERAHRYIGFDMEAATVATGSVISSVMFGALAGSGAVPFARSQFEDAIRASGVAVDSNLSGFAAGYEAARRGEVTPVAPTLAPPSPTTREGRRLAERLARELPESAHDLALEGVRRLMDYQDAAYADQYLDRLAGIAAADSPARDWILTREAARYLALWMSYEDTVRVADLKTRRSRVDRVRGEVRAKDDQLLAITEFMHPRWQEVCETLPASLGRRLLASKRLTRLFAPLFAHGRHVETTSIRWFVVLHVLASLRRWRRSTLRYQEEQQRIEDWLGLVREAAAADPEVALEIAECQRLIKGYGDTFARGLRNYQAAVDAYSRVRGRPDAAQTVRRVREAALADEDGKALATVLTELRSAA